MMVMSLSKRYCLGGNLFVRYALLVDRIRLVDLAFDLVIFVMILNLGRHLRVILLNDLLLFKVKVSFCRVWEFTEPLVVDDNLCILAYVNTIDKGLESFPVSIEDNQLLINVLLGGSLSLENLAGKHQTDVEIVNLILLLNIPDRELVNDIFQVLQMSVFNISALQEDMVGVAVTELAGSP